MDRFVAQPWVAASIQVHKTGAPYVKAVHTQPAAVRGRRLQGRLVRLPAQTSSRKDNIAAAGVRIQTLGMYWCG